MAESARKVVYTVNFYWVLGRLEEEADAVNLAVSVFSDRRCLSLAARPRVCDERQVGLLHRRPAALSLVRH